MGEDDPEPQAARRTRARLASADGDRRLAALARFVDLLDPDQRPEAFPDPAAIAEMADPLGRLSEHRSLADAAQAKAQLPYGLLQVDPRQLGVPLAQLLGLAIAAGDVVQLTEATPEDEPVVRAARQALSEAGLGEDAIVVGDDAARVDAVVGDPPDASSEQGAVQLVVDGTADPDAVVNLARTATREETSRLDTVIVHEALAVALVEDLVDALADEGLTVQAGEAARRRAPRADPASADTWRGQPGVCGVRVVGSLAEALEHAHAYAGPAAGIATEQAEAAERFARTVPCPELTVNVAPRCEDQAPAHPARVDPAPTTPGDLTCQRTVTVRSEPGGGVTIGQLAGWLRHHLDEA